MPIVRSYEFFLENPFGPLRDIKRSEKRREKAFRLKEPVMPLGEEVQLTLDEDQRARDAFSHGREGVKRGVDQGALVSRHTNDLRIPILYIYICMPICSPKKTLGFSFTSLEAMWPSTIWPK